MAHTPRRSRPDAEEAGRRHLAALDPAVLRRVVGRPEDRDAPAVPRPQPAGTHFSATYRGPSGQVVPPAHRRG